MPLGMEVGLGPGHIVLDGELGTQLPPQKRGHSLPHFLAHVCRGQAEEWIKMSLDTEVGVGPGHIVLHRGPTPRHGKGHSKPPHFWPMSIVAKQSPWISAAAELLYCL